MNVNMINDKNKEYLAMNVGKMYRDSLILMQEDNMYINERAGGFVCIKMKEKIDDILESMRLEYAFIIKNEFLLGNKDNYYQEYFTFEEYELYKKAAINTFLHCLYG